MLLSNKHPGRGRAAALSLVLAAALAACGSSPAASSSGNTTASGGSTGGSGGQGGSSGSSAGSGATGGSGGGTTSAGGGPAGWVLDWADEFDLPDGSPPDPAKWTPLVGGDGWGNQEREYYTNDVGNAHVQGGALQIIAKKDGADQHQCWYGTCQYTSARLQTKGKLERTLGRFEARMQIPKGQGVWPAFWMLGGNIDQAGWPGCGEIDIMENIGKEPGTVHGSLHGPGYSGGMPLTGSTKLPGGAALGDDFHLYAVEWEQDQIRFYLDDALYETHTPKDVPAGAKWVYDHPFFLLLNLAIGGQWPGDPDGSTMFPATLKVDYVRVYKRP
jgi:beta-glucanase (GH16 family)